MELEKMKGRFEEHFKKTNPESNGNFSVLFSNNKGEWFSCSCGYCTSTNRSKLKKTKNCWGTNNIECPSCGKSVYYEAFTDPMDDTLGIYYTFETEEKGDCDIIEITCHGIKFEDLKAEECNETLDTIIGWDRKNKRLFTIYNSYNFLYTGLSYTEKGVVDGNGYLMEYSSFDSSDFDNFINYGNGYEAFVGAGLIDLAKELARITGIPDFTQNGCIHENMRKCVPTLNSLVKTFINVTRIGFLSIQEDGEHVETEFGTYGYVKGEEPWKYLYFSNPLITSDDNISKVQEYNKRNAQEYDFNAPTLERCLNLGTKSIDDTISIMSIICISDQLQIASMSLMWENGMLDELLAISKKMKPNDIPWFINNVKSFRNMVNDEKIETIKDVFEFIGLYDEETDGKHLNDNIHAAMEIIRKCGQIFDMSKKFSEQNVMIKAGVVKNTALTSKQFDALCERPTLDNLSKLLFG